MAGRNFHPHIRETRKERTTGKPRSANEWAQQTRDLRARLGISQSELARLLDCSAMTVSRWEKGRVAPSAHYYIELGKLAGKPDCWFYWEKAGLQSSDVVRVLPERERKQLPAEVDAELDHAHAGPKAKMVHIPVLQATAGTHGGEGDKRSNLSRIPARTVMGAPQDWCPHPGYTSLIRINGQSMEPLIHNGDIAAVDSSDTDRGETGRKDCDRVPRREGAVRFAVSAILEIRHAGIGKPGAPRGGVGKPGGVADRGKSVVVDLGGAIGRGDQRRIQTFIAWAPSRAQDVYCVGFK